jgi:murein DD-endopeptidase MepM/ murein hydrolase activator NlpD
MAESAPIIRLAALAAGLTTIVLCAIALAPARSHGVQLASINQRIQSTRGKLVHARGREQVLTGDISALSSRIGTLAGQIAALQRRESRAQAILDARLAELERVRARYEEEYKRYVKLRKELVKAQGVLATRLVAIYKSDQPDLLTVVLEADGFNDLLVRADYLSRIGQRDAEIVGRVKTLKEESQRKKELLEALKKRAEAAVAEIAAKRRELAQARAGIQSRQASLSAARSQKRGSLANVRVSRRRLEDELAAEEAASARVTAQLQGSAGHAPVGPIRQGSHFIWPVNGPVVSPFGMRWGRLHAGVDIAVPSGTPIRAAGSGTVAIAGWVGGYGNYTCINHGGGISTCYGHQQSIGVSVGQHVSQAQVIGDSDCTGHCLGPHVHFEVRINGQPVDPMGYL